MTAETQAIHIPGRFDFGLSAVQEARAARLHRECVVFDMLSQHAGGNIFSHYPRDLLVDFEARMAASGASAWVEAIYWPYEMSKLGKSDLLWDWFRDAGLSCGAYDIDRLVDKC